MVTITTSVSKPRWVKRSTTTETTTTAPMSQNTEEDDEDMNSYWEQAEEEDDSSIHDLIDATARRWRHETAQTVMKTSTGANFPSTSSALQQLQQDTRPMQAACALLPPMKELFISTNSTLEDDLTVDTDIWAPEIRRPIDDASGR